MKQAKQNELLSVLLALEDRIMRRLQVASFGVVTKLDTVKNKCIVRPFPVEDASSVSEIVCVYAEHLEVDLVPGSIVVVLFMDKDFRKNLELVLEGNKLAQTVSSKQLHGDAGAVVVQVFKKEVV